MTSIPLSKKLAYVNSEFIFEPWYRAHLLKGWTIA